MRIAGIALIPLAGRSIAIGGAVLIFAGGVREAGYGTGDMAFWAQAIAPAIFLWAVWAATGILVRLDRREPAGPAIVSGLRATGAALMLGVFASVILEPSLIHLAGNGFTQMRGIEFDMSIETFCLLLTGLVLVLIARRTAAMKAQLDGFV